jgi:hypothetical protein
VKPFIWKDGDIWFVSPRNQYQVLYWKTYPGTKGAGYPSLREAFNDTVKSLTLSPS